MSETIERLRNAVGMLRDADGAYLDDDGEYASVESAERQYVAALAAVEQEIAELRKDCDVWEEAAEALEAELDELRKLPTHKEVTRAIWQDAPMGLDGNGVRIEVARNVDKLFDAKAAQ